MYLKSYKELIVWQKSINLVKEVYILTKQFPKEEIYGLGIQMRRAVISIPSNIAEGQRRKNLTEFLQFLRISDASSAELETQIVISKRLYAKLDYSKVDILIEEIQKMLKVMIRKLEDNNLKAKSYKLNAFTLIELLVAMTIFIIASAVAGTCFIQAVRSQKAIASLIASNNNSMTALEQMSREIRTGSDFSVTADGGLKFTNAKNTAVVYRLRTGIIEKQEGAEADFKPLTAEDVKIQNLIFNLEGGSAVQPRITISLRISPEANFLQNFAFNLQMTVSPRILGRA